MKVFYSLETRDGLDARTIVEHFNNTRHKTVTDLISKIMAWSLANESEIVIYDMDTMLQTINNKELLDTEYMGVCDCKEYK